jgi:hypothetical protein
MKRPEDTIKQPQIDNTDSPHRACRSTRAGMRPAFEDYGQLLGTKMPLVCYHPSGSLLPLRARP